MMSVMGEVHFTRHETRGHRPSAVSCEYSHSSATFVLVFLCFVVFHFPPQHSHVHRSQTDRQFQKEVRICDTGSCVLDSKLLPMSTHFLFMFLSFGHSVIRSVILGTWDTVASEVPSDRCSILCSLFSAVLCHSK
jgi:hypothetical protein